MVTDTIIAQCTPSGSGAIALLRVSGQEALTIVNRCAKLTSSQSLVGAQSHTINHGWIINDRGDHLDEVLFLVMHAPRTFTGFHVVEITTHNNPFIIESVITRIIECGARPAQNGEFTRQAVENGKIDLVQAEAINELIHANSQQQLKQSLEQLEGSFSSWTLIIEKDLLKISALCEASFEFLEEDVDFSDQIRTLLKVILQKIATVKQAFDQQQHLRQGIRIALIGSVNAGKSSLFNALVGKKRAIVTDIAGTTRDVIEAGLYKNGAYWTLIDTAGLRTTDDSIEKEGIKRSHEEAHAADIVLLVIDNSRAMIEEEHTVYKKLLEQYVEKIIIIKNKADLAAEEINFSHDTIMLSTKNNDDIKTLEELIQKKIDLIFTTTHTPFLLNKRHFTLLTGLEHKLFEVQTMLSGNIAYELVAYHLTDALENISQLTGKSITEKMMDTIFKEFCVGK